MSNLFSFVCNKLFDLGLIARLLLVVVKPLCLWLSLSLDSDKGVGLAQIFLLGMLFVAMCGSNAHKLFYEVFFNSGENKKKPYYKKYYINYLYILGYQLLLIIPIAVIVSILLSNNIVAIAIMGVVFGLGEKINDEYQRYAQFCNDSKKLLTLAVSKWFAAIFALFLSFFGIIDTGYSFSVLVLLFSIILNKDSVIIALRELLRGVNTSFIRLFKKSFFLLRADATQIGWVFTGMALISADRWLIQYINVDFLPHYMLLAQVAAISTLIQNIFLIAPVRVRLINEDPGKIRSLKIGSIIISAGTVFVGGGVYWFEKFMAEGGGVGHFAFLLAAIAVFSMPYGERLYWVVTAAVRISIDLMIVVLYILMIFSVFSLDFGNKLNWCLALLVFVLLVRLLFFIYLLKLKQFN